MLPSRNPPWSKKDRISFRDDPYGIFPGRMGGTNRPVFPGILKDREGPEIVMENVLDEDWRLLLDVYRIVDHPKFKLCLDMGHAHCYSEISVLEWAKELAPCVGHVHIHDNAGDRDSHLGLGKGTIPWEKVLKLLPCTKERTWTIECSNKEDVILCIKQIKEKMRGKL